MVGLNQLIVEALQNWVELRKEAQIDDEFMAMARDVDYISETLDMEGEFASSDHEVVVSSFSED
jgi:hypothetical protein